MITRRLRPADIAWAVMVAGIVAYEVSAPEGELLSEGCYRYIARHPWLIRFIIMATAAHLMRAIPTQFDVYQRELWRSGAVWVTTRYRGRVVPVLVEESA